MVERINVLSTNDQCSKFDDLPPSSQKVVHHGLITAGVNKDLITFT